MKKRYFFISILCGLYFFYCCTSCSTTIYNVTNSKQNPIFDSIKGKLFIRVINDSKFGISSLSFETDSGYIQYGGLLPHDTTNYFTIPPTFNRPNYKVTIMKTSFAGKFSNISLIGLGIDKIGDLKLASGFYNLKVNIEKNAKKLRVANFTISK